MPRNTRSKYQRTQNLKRYYRWEFIRRHPEYRQDYRKFHKRFSKSFRNDTGMSLGSVAGNFGQYFSRITDQDFSVWYRAFVVKWGLYGPCDPDFTVTPQSWDTLKACPGIFLGPLGGLQQSDGSFLSLRNSSIDEVVRLIVKQRATSPTFDEFLQTPQGSHNEEEYRCQLRIEEAVNQTIDDIYKQFHLVPKAKRMPKAESRFAPRQLDALLQAWDTKRPEESLSSLAKRLFPETTRKSLDSTRFEKDTPTERARSHYRGAEKMILQWGFTRIV